MKKILLSIFFLIFNLFSAKSQNFDCDFSEDFESPIPKCFVFSRDTFEVEYTLFPNPTDGEIQVDSEKPVFFNALLTQYSCQKSIEWWAGLLNKLFKKLKNLTRWQNLEN